MIRNRQPNPPRGIDEMGELGYETMQQEMIKMLNAPIIVRK